MDSITKCFTQVFLVAQFQQIKLSKMGFSNERNAAAPGGIYRVAPPGWPSVPALPLSGQMLAGRVLKVVGTVRIAGTKLAQTPEKLVMLYIVRAVAREVHADHAVEPVDRGAA